MRKTAIALLLVALMPFTAQAVEIIGGGAAGYCLGGPDVKATYFTATAGAMVKTFNEGWTKLYTVGRYNGTELNSQWGVKAILANKITTSGVFWWIIDAGALDGGFVNADGTDEITPSFGTGPTVVLSKFQSVSLYGECWRANASEWNKTLWITTQFHVFE